MMQRIWRQHYIRTVPPPPMDDVGLTGSRLRVCRARMLAETGPIANASVAELESAALADLLLLLRTPVDLSRGKRLYLMWGTGWYEASRINKHKGFEPRWRSDLGLPCSDPVLFEREDRPPLMRWSYFIEFDLSTISVVLPQLRQGYIAVSRPVDWSPNVDETRKWNSIAFDRRPMDWHADLHPVAAELASTEDFVLRIGSDALDRYWFGIDLVGACSMVRPRFEQLWGAGDSTQS